jgi:hypothetical protein
MSADNKIAQFTNQLEDAGELGYIAFTLLAPFLASGPETGAWRGTDTGFVWSKTMGGGFANRLASACSKSPALFFPPPLASN